MAKDKDSLLVSFHQIPDETVEEINAACVTFGLQARLWGILRV
jgi:hypothetical protein